MKQRRDRLARATHITETLWRLQQMRLAQREAELGEIRAAAATALKMAERVEPAVINHRLVVLSRRRSEAEQAIALIRELARDYGARAKLAAKSYRKADEATQQEEADKELRRLSSADVSARKGA